MTNPNAIPAGYWKNAAGNLIPEAKVKPIDKLRHQVVVDLCLAAEQAQAGLRKFKLDAMQEVAALVATSLEEYGVKTGGDKGNVTLMSYDGEYKLVRSMQDKLIFGEQLMAAKALIDECVHEWSEGANDNIRVLVNHAFQADKEGKINVGRVLALRQVAIDHPKWKQAMQAIADSMQTASTKPYVRFYKRSPNTQEYLPIVLDIAGA